jgi:Fic family protein
MTYQPPFNLTTAIVNRVAEISERCGALRYQLSAEQLLRLRRINQIRTVTGSLAIEGNTLTELQITALLNGKRVLAPPREIQEAKNALAVYAQLDRWQPQQEADLRTAHAEMMAHLLGSAGHYRQTSVGVVNGKEVIHMAPPANQVPRLMADLFGWIETTDMHPLIASSIFHYEFEFIHPFEDGNGRMGRLWQTLLLRQWSPLLGDMPVESLIYQHQAGYYEALQQSTDQTDSAPFVQFLLERIIEALEIGSTPEVYPDVTPEVARLLAVLQGEMSSAELMQALGLKDEKHFRQNYRQKAIDAGVIAMTRPDSPRSSRQRYRLTPLGEQIRNQQEGS